MSSPEQDRPLQCAEDTKGEGWQETVPEILTCFRRAFRIVAGHCVFVWVGVWVWVGVGVCVCAAHTDMQTCTTCSHVQVMC